VLRDGTDKGCETSVLYLASRKNVNLIKIVVNASTINGLRQQCLYSVPRNFVRRQIGTALKGKK